LPFIHVVRHGNPGKVEIQKANLTQSFHELGVNYEPDLNKNELDQQCIVFLKQTRVRN